MCSLVVRYRPGPGIVLLVAANRDERLDRPASGPQVWIGEPFAAPRDEVAGGTWLGLTAGGTFVAITNRFGSPPDPSRRSRGALVVDALRQPGAGAIRAFLAGIPPEQHNGFHLFYADRETAFVTWSDGVAMHHEPVAPGLLVVTERSHAGATPPRERRIRQALAHEDPTLDAMGEALRIHDDADPLAATCVHVPLLGYGTRSALRLSLGEDPGAVDARWCEGPPCTQPFSDVSATFRGVTG
jgi:uncharacterized protein with NRDE domain